MEKVKPAGVNSEGDLAEISGGVCPPSGILVANPLTTIVKAKATMLPIQVLGFLLMRAA